MTLADLPVFASVVSPEHEEVRVRRGARSGLTVAVAIHRTVNGRSLGGCRMYPYETTDDAIRDVARLAKAMTFKAAAAGLRLGGAKGVIALEGGRDGVPGLASPERRRAALLDFGDLVDSFGGRYVTAQDVGVSLDDIAVVGQATRHIVGRPVGAGDPSPYTAHGVEVAIRASLQGAPLGGRHVAVVGLGNVGGALARRLARAGARLTLSDLDPAKQRLADELGATWEPDPGTALIMEADVVAPCALGGVITDDTVDLLRTPVVAGAANNQLADDDLALRLKARGIRWAPDFITNAGGLIAVADELGGFDRSRVEREIEGIAVTLADVYGRADSAGTDTLTAARELALERLID